MRIAQHGARQDGVPPWESSRNREEERERGIGKDLCPEVFEGGPATIVVMVMLGNDAGIDGTNGGAGHDGQIL